MTMERAEIVESDGQKTIRYMKAIPAAELCLTCHGSNIPPDVVTHLDKFYPNDDARNLKEGNLRAAFTLSKKLQREFKRKRKALAFFEQSIRWK